MAIDAENPTPEQFAAMGLECTRTAIEGLLRRLAGLQRTNVNLDADNARLRGQGEELERQLAGCQETNAALARDNANLRGRVAEMDKHLDDSLEARQEFIDRVQANPLATLNHVQQGMLWAAISCQIKSMESCLRHRELLPGPAPKVGDIMRMIEVRTALFPGGQPEPESGGENLAGG